MTTLTVRYEIHTLRITINGEVTGIAFKRCKLCGALVGDPQSLGDDDPAMRTHTDFHGRLGF